MKRILFVAVISLLLSSNVFSESVNPNDDFLDPTLDLNFWTESSDATYGSNYTSAIVDNNYVSSSSGVNALGAVRLKTNFHFTSDFDANIRCKVNVTTYLSTAFSSIRFFKSNQEIIAGDYGTTWGYAGNEYGSWFGDDDNIIPWLYADTTPGDTNYLNPIDEWFNLRIQRIDDDVYTYFKLDSDQDWNVQNTYTDFGTEAVYLTYVSGTGSYDYIESTLDYFHATGYADTDPTGTHTPVPEPTSLLLLATAVIGLVRKLRK